MTSVRDIQIKSYNRYYYLEINVAQLHVHAYASNLLDYDGKY